jgi:predicted O-methyltransferase YrrM
MPQQSYKATDPAFEDYAEAHTTPESDLLHRLYRETSQKSMYPSMLSGHLQGQFLRMISQMLRPKKILEIGTFTGYGTINLAMGLADGGVIHTIDSNEEMVEVGKPYFEAAGLQDKIVTHIGNAITILDNIDKDFDLVFIDADKENYLIYYKMLIEALPSGGIILADNVLWYGKVLDPANADEETEGILRFNKFVLNDERVENMIVPMRDGLMMVRKK